MIRFLSVKTQSMTIFSHLLIVFMHVENDLGVTRNGSLHYTFRLDYGLLTQAIALLHFLRIGTKALVD